MQENSSWINNAQYFGVKKSIGSSMVLKQFRTKKKKQQHTHTQLHTKVKHEQREKEAKRDRRGGKEARSGGPAGSWRRGERAAERMEGRSQGNSNPGSGCDCKVEARSDAVKSSTAQGPAMSGP